MTNVTGKPKPTDVSGLVDRVVRPLTRVLNPLILRIAGGWWFPMFSLIRHRGYKSGRTYSTPVTGFPRGGFFWLGLAFGQSSGWARNVLTAGEADLRYRGADYHLVDATVVDVAEVKDQLPAIVRVGCVVGGMDKVLRMRVPTEK